MKVTFDTYSHELPDIQPGVYPALSSPSSMHNHRAVSRSETRRHSIATWRSARVSTNRDDGYDLRQVLQIFRQVFQDLTRSSAIRGFDGYREDVQVLDRVRTFTSLMVGWDLPSHAVLGARPA